MSSSGKTKSVNIALSSLSPAVHDNLAFNYGKIDVPRAKSIKFCSLNLKFQTVVDSNRIFKNVNFKVKVSLRPTHSEHTSQIQNKYQILLASGKTLTPYPPTPF